MELNIDVSNLVAEVLKVYPSCAHLKGKFEETYQTHYEKLKDSVAASSRLGGLDGMIESYEVPFIRNRDYYLKTDFTGYAHNSGKSLDEVNAEHEVEIEYFKQVIDGLKALQEFQRRSAKPEIKDNYCCSDTHQIMQGLVNQYNVSQIDVRFFEDFFMQHPYTNLDLGNVCRDQTTKDLDFGKLIYKIFEVASLFEGDVRDYFFACVEKDAEQQNKGRWDTDCAILINKIQERLNSEKTRLLTALPIKGGQKKQSLTFEQLFISGGMERALTAAASVGVIKKGERGYTWNYTGAKSHRVCAFWFAAKEAGLTKKNLKNNERITGAIQAFFQMNSLAKGTLDNVNEIASEFVNLKKKLKDKMLDLQ